MKLLRAMLAPVVALLAGSCGSSEPVAIQPGGKQLTVVVLVVDSLMQAEVTPSTPNLNALKGGGMVTGENGPVPVDGGTFYVESRSVYSAETIPNHVAMMTGVNPQRSGIPTNDFIDVFNGSSTVKARLSIPERLTANTLFTWIDLQCRKSGLHPGFKTGATLSKKYLHDVFAGDALSDRANDNPNVFNLQPDTFFDPENADGYIPAPDEHVPDAATMSDARTRIAGSHFFFINLGDVDRSAHIGGPGFRATALTDTDQQVGLLVGDLIADKLWPNTVMFVVSDHGMDFSEPGPATLIATTTTLNELTAECGQPAMKGISSGGTQGIWVLDRTLPLDQRQAALRVARACLTDAAACAAACPTGITAPTRADLIGGAWYTTDDPLDPAGNMPATIASKHVNMGDLTVWANPTGKFGDSQSDANGQIPGNHGHPVTLHNTFLVTGGSPWVKKQVIASSVASPTVYDRLPEQSENIDIAPTVAWLLGLGVQAAQFPDYPQYGNGFDGRILQEAFTQFDTSGGGAPPTVCGRFD